MGSSDGCECVPMVLMQMVMTQQMVGMRADTRGVEVFEDESVKVGKKTCICSFSFTMAGNKVKKALGTCDKKCSGNVKKLSLNNDDWSFTFGFGVKKGKVKMGKVTAVGGSTGGNGTGGASGDCKCGLAKRRTRIVGGVETEVNEWPWQAGMVWSGSSSVFCGATVISDEWILTASHCVDGTNPAEIQVLLGEHDYWDSAESSMTRMDISEIIMHGDYDSNTVDQDFALLKMARKLDWSANENI